MKKQNGFTLFESITAIVIVMILAIMTVTGLNYQTQRRRDEVLRLELLQVLLEGRTEADNLNKALSLCKSKDQHHCGGNWADALLLFIDDAGEGQVNGVGQILSVTHLKQRDGKLYSRFYPHYREFIQFMPASRQSSDNGTIWYCHVNAHSPAWAIKVNRMGAAETILPDKNGVIKDTQGDALHCGAQVVG